MISDIRAKFVPRFVVLSRERLSRSFAAAALGRDDYASEIARELHALAGEAGLLGLSRVLEIARHAESLARRLEETRGEADRERLTASMRELEQAVMNLGHEDMCTEID